MSSNRTLNKPGSSKGIAPEFLVPPDTLDTVSPSGHRGGMMLGTGMQDEPLTLSLLRPAPTRVVTVGGLYLARQIALRAMATGAWVIIATGRPAEWQPVSDAAGTGPDGKPIPLVQIRRLSPIDPPHGTEDGPLLVVHDGGAVPQELFAPRSAWQTTMYVLPYLHPQAGAGVATNSADHVLLQRLPVSQAQLAQRIWYLDTPKTHELTQLPDDHIAALGPNAWRRIRLTTTPREQELLGPIRRGD